jgi:lipopolysaccharide exporter
MQPYGICLNGKLRRISRLPMQSQHPQTASMLISKPQVKGIFSKLRKSSFVQNIMVVMSGSALAQIIGVALTPLISRFFSPSDFGIFGSFIAVSGVIAAGVTLQYSQAVMLPKEKGDALNLFLVSCIVTALVSFFCLVVCLIAPGVLLNLMSAPSMWILVILIIATFVNGLNIACQAWCVRVKAFKHTSASQVVRSLSSNGAQIGFGFLRGGAMGLIISTVVADLVATFNLVRVLLQDLSVLRNSIRWKRMKQLALEYRDFPMYSASQNVVNALSSGLPVLLLTHFYGIVVAGTYAFGVRILQVPMGFVLGALRQVLFQKAGETLHQGNKLAPLYVKITLGLFCLGLLPSFVLFLWAPEIFSLIFGSQWHMAGEFARSLIVWLMFYFCNLPAVLFAQVIRIQRTIFIYDIVLLAARLTSLVLGGAYLNAWQTIMLFSLVGAVMNLFLVFLVGHAVMKREGRTDLRSIRDILIDVLP